MVSIKRFSRNDWWLVLSLVIMILLFISSGETYKQQTSVPFLERWLANEPFKQQLKIGRAHV